jgi:hypothetical protein
MSVLAVEKSTIGAHVIRYFHDVFRDPISAFKPSTNVRKAYSYSDAAWRQLANVFNKLSWMRRLDVLLSPRAMPGLKTIEDLTNAIWVRLPKLALPKPRSVRRSKVGARSMRKSKVGARSMRKSKVGARSMRKSKVGARSMRKSNVRARKASRRHK